jgi:2-polyprenyl-3-methyl-5-hydroxy-6-metoxy-1,4-benzoquinol methylase
VTMQSLESTVSDRDNWSSHWSAYAESVRENPAQRMRHKLLLNQIRSEGGEIALLIDIGSGQGDFLATVVQSGGVRRCVGFELSEIGVSISRAKVPTATFHQVDLFAPSAEAARLENQADVVVCSEVIEHVDDSVGFCRLMETYLKPGGRLLVTVPGGPMSTFDHYIGHRLHYDRASITRVLDAAGFKVEAVELAGFPFFNLYRIVVILLGKRLISSAKRSGAGTLASLVMALFRTLFRFNLRNSVFGWQVLAVARRPPGDVMQGGGNRVAAGQEVGATGAV